jgi:hypothetical protein
MTEKNPFKKDDGFIEVLKNNPKIKDLSQSNYKQFVRKNSMSNDTQPATSTYLKLVHFITKNAFVSTIVMLLLLGTLGVSAAQVFAPEELKPFRSNKSETFSSMASPSNSSLSLSSISSSSSSILSSEISSQASSLTLSTPKLQTYTTQFLPNLKIVYAGDWAITTVIKSSIYNNLSITNVILTKNNYQVLIYLVPATSQPRCSGMITLIKEDKLNNGVSKFTLQNTNDNSLWVGYGKSILPCTGEQSLISNLKAADFQDYSTSVANLKYVPNKNLVTYFYSISAVKQTGEQIIPSDLIISEIDQIVSQSTFN